MKIPAIPKRTLIVVTGILLVIGSIGFGLRLMLHRADVPTARNDGESADKPRIRMVHFPMDTDGASESASVRRGGERSSVVLDWGKRTLIENVRNMEVAQSGLAAGENQASTELKNSMMAISRYLQSTKPEDLQPEEIESVTEYTLSGGQPTFANKILEARRLGKIQDALLRGLVAFVQGKKEQANKILAPIDARQFKPVISARLLMVQAELADTAPYEVRRTKLAKAADLALGTLIEEGAIRRLVILAANAHRAGDFHYWSDRYVRRFSKSLYIEDFLSSYIDGLSTFETNKLPLVLERVDGVYSMLPQEGQTQFAIKLLQAALRLGEPRLCNYAYLKSKDLSGEGMYPDDGPKLYSIACKIGEPGAEILSQLSQFDVVKLAEADRELHAAVKALAQGVDYQSTELLDPVYGPSLPYPQLGSVKALSARVRQQFGSTDAVLKGIGK